MNFLPCLYGRYVEIWCGAKVICYLGWDYLCSFWNISHSTASCINLFRRLTLGYCFSFLSASCQRLSAISAVSEFEFRKTKYTIGGV